MIVTKGKHSCEMQVPKFFGSKLCTPTLRAVDDALAGMQRSLRDRSAMAAFIWYSRSNGRKWFFSPSCADRSTGAWLKDYGYYCGNGVFPIDPKRLERIKLSTLLKYSALLDL